MKGKILLLLSVFTFLFPKYCSAYMLFSFEGHIDFTKNQFQFALDFPAEEDVFKKRIDLEKISPQEGGQRAVTLSGKKTSESDYRFSLDIEHLKTPLCDLMSKIESSVEVVKDEEKQDHLIFTQSNYSKVPFFRGKIWSQYSLVDYKPIRELSGRFEIKDQRLFLTFFSFGNVSCQGFIDLISPYKLDLSIKLSSVDMEDFLNFWTKRKKHDSSGTVSGEIMVSGTLNRLSLRGNLESRDGHIEKLEYNNIYLAAEGIYPNLRVKDTTVSKTDGVSFTLDGMIDLSDQKNFKKQIKALTFSPLVSDSLSEREWTIKRLKQRGSAETEIKYLLRKGNVTGAPLEDDSGMFGLERTMEF